MENLLEATKCLEKFDFESKESRDEMGALCHNKPVLILGPVSMTLVYSAYDFGTKKNH